MPTKSKSPEPIETNNTEALIEAKVDEFQSTDPDIKTEVKVDEIKKSKSSKKSKRVKSNKLNDSNEIPRPDRPDRPPRPA